MRKLKLKLGKTIPISCPFPKRTYCKHYITISAALVPSHQVSTWGQYLDEYEALLYESFGPHAIECTTLTLHGVTHQHWWADRLIISPAQANEARSSGLTSQCLPILDLALSTCCRPHSRRPPATALRATSGPLTINNHYVACDKSATKLLISYGETLEGTDGAVFASCK